MLNKKYFLIIVCVTIVIKIFLFLFAEIHDPKSKFLQDSASYLETGKILISKGVFAFRDTNGSLHHEFRRTPGYPLFLGVLHGALEIPLGGVVFIQILLTILTALLVYKTAMLIDPELAFLSAGMVLCSPVIFIYSMMILTEPLFLFFITLFMFYFVRYMESGGIKFLIISSLMLVLAAYVRPGGYFLGAAIAAFVVYANVTHDMKKAIWHAFVLLAVVYGLLGIWQLRNYMDFKNPTFCIIFQEDSGFYKNYPGNAGLFAGIMGQLQYYSRTIFYGLVSLMTRPGSFKYFHCYTLTIFGKVLGYPWMVFWMGGFLYGITKIGHNRYYQFLMFVIVCFIYGSIIGAIHYLGGRFRIPMEPFIAIISAYGWQQLMLFTKARILVMPRKD